MASIGTLFPSASSAPSALSKGSNSSNPASSAQGTDALANQNTFLQLLVAQLKNQDPTQPMDGTAFVTQLAQFSSLQENVATRQDLDGISKQYLGTIPSDASTTPSTAGSASTIPSGSTVIGQ